MNFIDLFLIGLVILAAYRGFKKGFILELFTLLAFYLGFYAAIHFSDFMSSTMYDSWEWDSKYIPVVSFLICFLAVGAMVFFAGKALEKVVRVVQLGLINRLFGMLFSMLTMILLLGGLIIISKAYDERNDIISDETKENSLLYYPILNTAETLVPAAEESRLYLKNTLEKNESEPKDEN